uniref:Dihydrolipoyl dehydrogenase, mitochondrial n=1 Tax=Phallusia mammillata TaxID=59560 RepID=A0A6F9DB75_9ASCI|nr:dihydrolipoyl dehydrogenase, mitochondrial [Phallusia mammillata]
MNLQVAIKMPTKRKRHELTLKDKVKVIEEIDKGAAQVTLAQKYDVSQSQVSRLAKHRDKLLSEYHNNVSPCRKRARAMTHENVGDALLEWFHLAKSKGIMVNGPLLRKKAKDFALLLGEDFNPSMSWVTRWRERHSIFLKRQDEVKLYQDSEATEQWITSVWPSIQERYSASEIYNCDETGIYFRKLPEKSMYIVNEKLSGDQKCMERLTVLLATNMDGSDKQELLVIGKTMESQCFTGIKKLPIKYRSNSSAWVTPAIFQEWLESFDERLQEQNKKICLLLDSCFAHKIEEKGLRCVELVYLPPNSVPSVQPLDQGITKNMKHYYRRRLLQKILLSIEANEATTAAEVAWSLSVLDAVNLLSASWNDVSAETIQYCFFRGLSHAVPDEHFVGFSPDEIPPGFNEKTYAEYINIDDMIDIGGISTDEVETCREVVQYTPAVTAVVTNQCSAILPVINPPNNKEVLDSLDVIRRWLQLKGMKMDTFTNLETEILDNMQSNIKKGTIAKYLK